MNPKLLGPFLVATSMAAAVTAGQSYTLKTSQGDFSIQVNNTQQAFQVAADQIAEMAKSATPQTAGKQENFALDLGKIQDEKGEEIGTCSIVGYNDEYNVEPQTASFHYKINCWDGTKADSAVFAELSFNQK